MVYFEHSEHHLHTFYPYLYEKECHGVSCLSCSQSAVIFKNIQKGFKRYNKCFSKCYNKGPKILSKDLHGRIA